MKQFIACAVFGLSAAAAQGPGPVSVTLNSPINGSTVSGTIMLNASASSLAGPIVKVEFYRDGVLFATVYRTNQPGAPGTLRTTASSP